MINVFNSTIGFFWLGDTSSVTLETSWMFGLEVEMCLFRIKSQNVMPKSLYLKPNKVNTTIINKNHLPYPTFTAIVWNPAVNPRFKPHLFN
jgi:hypothetical protein